MAFVDIYGLVTPPIKQGIKVQSLDEYSSLIFTLSKQGDTHFVVELLNQQGDPVKRTTAIDGTAQFYYITPGKYYARMFATTTTTVCGTPATMPQDYSPK